MPSNSDMVIHHAYFSSSGGDNNDRSSSYYRNDVDYREAILGRRSPVKNNAFRTSRSSSRTKKKWCVCGRQLVFFKEAECWSCTECGHTEYIEHKKQQAPTTTATNSSGIGSIDGLSDSQTRPNRGATKFRHIKDPRSRFLKPKSQLDPELQKLVDEQGVTIISYNERVEEDSQLVSSNELRSNK